MKNYLPIVLMLLTFGTACSSSQKNPLLREFPIHGQTYCEEFKDAVELALDLHLTREPEELSQIFRSTTNRVIALFQSQVDSNWELKALSELRKETAFVSEKIEMESYEDCRFQAAVGQYIENREIQKGEPESPYSFQLFLWAFTQQLDHFSYPIFEGRQEQARSYELKVDFDLARFYNISQTRAKVVHSMNKQIPAGTWVYALRPLLSTEPDTDLESDTSYRFQFSSTSELRSFDRILNDGQSSFSVIELKTSLASEQKDSKTVSLPSKARSLENSLNVSTQVSEYQIYIRLYSFLDKSSVIFESKLDAALAEHSKKFPNNTKPSIIIDLRNNPGGLTSEAYRIASFFISDGTVGFDQDKKGNIKEVTVEDSKPKYPDHPVLILVNHLSASSSELLAQLLSEFGNGSQKRALTIGETTFGKGIYQVPLLLKSLRTRLLITAGRYYGPNGKNVQETGLKPQIEVEDPLIHELRESCRSSPSRQCPYQYMKDLPQTYKIAHDPHVLQASFSAPQSQPYTQASDSQIETAKQKLIEKANEHLAAKPSIEDRFDYQKEFAFLLARLLFSEEETPAPENNP